MLELVTTASIITALVFLASRRFRSPSSFAFDSSGWNEDSLAAGDLPCPWCRANTREADRACPSCARVFGSPVPG